jgi:hypothetical protein
MTEPSARAKRIADEIYAEWGQADVVDLMAHVARALDAEREAWIEYVLFLCDASEDPIRQYSTPERPHDWHDKDSVMTPDAATVEPLICHRCERAIDAQEQGGYVEQVVLGRVRTPYHRRCWDENEHALDPSLRAQHAALVTGLKRYARHEEECERVICGYDRAPHDVHDEPCPCTCGYSTLLATLGEPEGT